MLIVVISYDVLENKNQHGDILSLSLTQLVHNVSMLQEMKNVYKKTHLNLCISLFNHLAVASSVSKLHCLYVNMPV